MAASIPSSIKHPAVLVMRRQGMTMPALGLIACLIVAPAAAGTGDLDPTFANRGRLSAIPEVSGAARRVELIEGGGLFVGGGEHHRVSYLGRCFFSASSFGRLVDETGAVDPGFQSAALSGTEAQDFARQPDGRVIAVGRTFRAPSCDNEIPSRLVAFRYESDGSLDAGFATDGLFRWQRGAPSRATSVALEPDGRIVFAGVGTPQSRLIVIRLLTDGTLDPGFGDAGAYIGPPVKSGDLPQLVRLESGAYRVTAGTSQGCKIIALTTDGVRDPAFGRRGIARISSPDGNPAYCTALEALDNGGVLVAGGDSRKRFVSKILLSGTPDATFLSGPALSDSMDLVTAIASAPNGGVLVAGRGSDGAVIMRLKPTGKRDASFGIDGRTLIRLATDSYSSPVVLDMAVASDGSAIAAGGDIGSGRPFVVRLLGDRGGIAPGVLGFSSENQAWMQESDGQAVFRVQRTGGRDGTVSIAYRTDAHAEASAGGDFTETAGTLHWVDGDSSEREIEVEVLEDQGPAESQESFRVVLEDPQGRAGIGTRNATIEIQPDGYPGGQITLLDGSYTFPERSGVLQVSLARDYYSEGEVCVEWRARTGTANANDFEVGRGTECWDNGEGSSKYVQVEIIDDARREQNETFFFELSNPTGGAIIGLQGQATVTILDND